MLFEARAGGGGREVEREVEKLLLLRMDWCGRLLEGKEARDGEGCVLI